MPVSVEDLFASSELVVVGHVDDIRVTEVATGRIVTQVLISVAETWKGRASTQIVLVEAGGVLGDRGEVVHGGPRYGVGEPVLVFASLGPLGWRTNHMLQGKFHLETAADGTVLAARELDTGVTVLTGRRSTWTNSFRLEELRAAATKSGAITGTLSDLPKEPIQIFGESSSSFTTQANNPRFFESDIGQPYAFVIDDRGDSILGLESSRRALGDAFAAWSAVSGSSLVLIDAGLTNDIGPAATDGIHRVLFDDPNDEIPLPVNCSGTLAQGGSVFTLSETKTFGGRTYTRILSGFLRFADGWDGCPQWIECNVSEVAGHEIGHAFGLGHSSENPNEPVPDLREALMYFRSHFDGRCAEPRNDDVNGIRVIYPAAPPPSVTTTTPLPNAVMGQFYSVTLMAGDITPPVTWESVGIGCPTVDDIPGLSLSTSGALEGNIPNFTDDLVESCFTIRVTDANGESHAKRLAITYVRVPPTPPSPTPTATPTPICDPTPRICRSAGKSILLVTDRTPSNRDRLVWKWFRGDATNTAEFADPTIDADYSLCLYTGAPNTLFEEVLIPASAALWKPINVRGFKYSDRTLVSEGIQKVILRAGLSQNARAVVIGKGDRLPDVTPPFQLPLTVQLVNQSSQACWGSRFESIDVRKNEPGKFMARVTAP